jgi:hypothetical protein
LAFTLSRKPGADRNTDEQTEQVSSKYLELTKKKLELTRLPHEVLLPKDREWEFGTPKGVVEPLIDFWYVVSAFEFGQ